MYTLKIIDVNGKERNASTLKKVVYKVHDAVHKNELIDKTYIEAQIIGKNGRTWITWFPFEEFVVANPNLVMEK